MEGVDLKISNPDPKTGVGEVVARSRGVMKGYYKDPELTKAAFTTDADDVGEGWFKTGDLGILRPEKGRLRLSLRGRSKNMILGPSGENIYPEDIEFVLNQHPLVNESLIVEDDNGLVALVQINEDKLKLLKRDLAYQKESILNEIQFYLNSRVNKSSKVERVQVVTEFEKTASQKIKRYLYDLRTKVGEKKGKKSKNDIDTKDEQ